jgi:hypothetical protein
MRIEGDAIVFESGRRVENACNCGIIGLSPGLDGMASGYDSGVCSLRPDDEFDDPGYTQKEKAEICDYMITLWKNAKNIIEADI